MTGISAVLYVEDCEVSTELLERSFNNFYKKGVLRFDIAPTISEALITFNQDVHCAALIDWNLPDGCGVEVARYIRQANKDLPLIFLSAILTDEHLVRIEDIPYATFLQKEYNEIFVQRVSDYLFPDI